MIKHEKKHRRTKIEAENAELRSALRAIAGADGSWNVIAYAEDVLDGIYDGTDYHLDLGTLLLSIRQFLTDL